MRSVLRALMMTSAVVSLSLTQAATVARQPSGHPLTPQERHGREVWFTSTFGGEKFFSLILPGPPFNLPLGFDQLLTSDRETRFQEYGVLNDPECVQGDASTGFFDRCTDPHSAGVIGIRK